MKKIALILSFCFLFTWAGAVRVDDFESYATGEVDTVTTTWKAGPTAATVIAEDAGSKVIQIKENAGGTGQKAAYGILSSGASIADGATGTLFFKYKVTNPLDCSFGMTNLDTPLLGGSSWSDFRIQIANVNGALKARDGSNTRDCLWASNSQAVTITAGQWYYMWVVITNAAGATTADNYKIYLNQTGNAATEADRLKHSAGDTFVFRTTVAEALDRIYWRAQNSSSALYMMVDNIYITGGTDLSNPNIFSAHNPTPSINAINIDTSSTLSWYTGKDPNNPANPNPNVTKHYVYMREGDPNLKYITPTEVTAGSPVNPTASCTPPVTLAMDKTYYWRVDESVNNSLPADANTIVGSIWSFATLKSIPDITQQPTAVRALEGTPAQLSVVFTSITPAAVTWKKYVDGVNDQTITDGVSTSDVSNVWTSTLSFTPVSATDDGQYYCLIVNDGTEGTPVKSNTVTVIANRLMAQYDFDDTLAPAAGSAADAPTGQGKTVAGVPDANSLLASNITLSFVTGVNGVGKAVSLTDPNQYVDFGTAGYPKAGSLPGGIGLGLDEGSLLCWVKPTNAQVIYTNYNDGNATGFALSLTGTTADGRINVRGQSGVNVGTISGKPDRSGWTMLDGAWHLLAATWKPGGTMKIYVDGQLAGSVAAGSPTAYAAWQRGVLLGAARNGSNRDWLTALFSGAVDNLRIFNYEQEANAIAQEYFDGTGIRPCISSIFDGSAYNYDNTGTSYCKVDFADFAAFAKEWLECGLYPSCQ